MSDYIPITGELRGVVNHTELHGVPLIELGEYEFGSRCDAIDSVHANLERENESLKVELDRVTGEMEEHHAWAPESHYIMLPKDSAGEPIHEHDKVDWRDHAGTWHENVTVVAVCNDGCYVMDGIVFHVHKSDIRHHHEPTVEDVLREFYVLAVRGKEAHAEDVDEGVLADFAAKLRLAGDA